MTQTGVSDPWIGLAFFDYVPKEISVPREKLRSEEFRRMLFANCWQLLPDDLKPYCNLVPIFVGQKGCFVGGDVITLAQLRAEILDLSDTHGIPVHPIVRMAYNRNSRQWCSDLEMPLEDVEEMFRKHPNVTGIKIVESGGEAGFFPDDRKYLMDAIRLGARYGKTVSFWDHANMWQILLLDEEFIELISQHPDTFIPLWETNGPLTSYADHGMPMGLWASGVVNRWGVNPQAGWYWYEAGYREAFGGRHMDGRESVAPDVMWGIMTMLGASAGASAFVYEGTEGWWWNYRGKFTECEGAEWDPDAGEIGQVELPEKLDMSDTFHSVICPTLRTLINDDLIPTREQVLEEVKIAYETRWLPDDTTPVWNPEMLRRVNWASGEFDDIDTLPAFWGLPVEQKKFYMGPLYDATYGRREGNEIIPNTSKHYWIPVFPKYARKHATCIEDPFEGKLVIGSGDCKTMEDFAKLVGEPGDMQHEDGVAWSATVGGAAFVTNTHENAHVPEKFSVEVGGRRIEGEIDSLMFLMASEADGSLRIYANSYIASHSARTLTFSIGEYDSEPAVEADVNGADCQVTFSPESKQATVALSFNGSAAIIIK